MVIIAIIFYFHFEKYAENQRCPLKHAVCLGGLLTILITLTILLMDVLKEERHTRQQVKGVTILHQSHERQKTQRNLEVIFLQQ